MNATERELAKAFGVDSVHITSDVAEARTMIVVSAFGLSKALTLPRIYASSRPSVILEAFVSQGRYAKIALAHSALKDCPNRKMRRRKARVWRGAAANGPMK